MADDDIRKPLAFQEEEKPMATPAVFKGPKTATTHGSVVMDIETDYVKPPICLKKRTCKDIALDNKESSTALVRKEKLTGANILSGETKCNDDEKTKMKNKATRKALKIKNAKESTEQAITLATSTNQQSIVQHALSKKKPRKRKVEYVPSQEAKHANERSRSLVANDPHGCKHMGIFDITPQFSIQTKPTLEYYLQPGKYLYGKCCKGKCQKPVNSFLQKEYKPPRDTPYVYYCDWGNQATKLNESDDPQLYAEIVCDYVICFKCKLEKEEEVSNLNSNKHVSRRSRINNS